MRIHADPDPQPCFEHYFMCLTTKKTPHDFFSLNLVKLDLDLDPDPHSEKLLDPDPYKVNADPQPCSKVRNNGTYANLLLKNLINLQLLAISLHFFCF